MKISVVVTTYNHEKYISQCLESITSQRGDFQLEVVVGDDCSTDNTRSIIQQFQKKYPEIISILPAENNLGVTKNLQRCLEACSGEYIAVCEGDDYWTDDFKLLKQKNLLESRKDFSMCFSAIVLYYEDQNVFVPHSGQITLKKDWITIEELIEINYIGNFSCCMYRSDVARKLSKRLFDFYTVDWMFNMACGQMGKIGFIQETMSVYRLHSNGAWTGKGELDKLDDLRYYVDIYNEFFDYKYDVLFTKLKEGIDDEIDRLTKVQELEKNSNMKFTAMRTSWINKAKNVLRPFVQKMKRLRELFGS